MAKRKKYQAELEVKVTERVQREQVRSVADDVGIVSALATSVVEKLGEVLSAEKFKTIRCTCGEVHKVKMPDVRVTTQDLVNLYKLRSMLKGDPDFRIEVGGRVEVNLANLSADDLRERYERALRESEAIVLG